MKCWGSASPFLCAHPLLEASGKAVNASAAVRKFASAIHEMVEKNKSEDSLYHVLWTSWKKIQIPFSAYVYMKVSGLRGSGTYIMQCINWEQNFGISWKIWPWVSKLLCCAPSNTQVYIYSTMTLRLKAADSSDEGIHLNEIN